MSLENTGGATSGSSAAQEEVRRRFLGNALAFVTFDSVWSVGTGFVLLATAIPSYLIAVGASKTLMQAVTLAIPLLTGLQLWSGAVCHGAHRKRRLFFVWSVFPASWITFGVLSAALWGRLPQEVFTALFVLTCLGLGASMHLGIPAYGELVLDCTPLRWRGRLSAVRNVTCNLLGLGGVYLAAVCKGRWEGMESFHYGAIAGGAFMAVSCLAIWFIRDVKDSEAPVARPAPIRAAVSLLRSPSFRPFLVFYGVFIAGQSLCPLVLSYGSAFLAMTQEEFTAAAFVGCLLAALLTAPLADRFGFRLLGIVGAALLTAAFCIMVVVPAGPAGRAAAMTAYACWGGANLLGAVVLPNLGSELAPDFKAATVIAVGQVLAMPLSLGVAPVGGLLVDWFGPSGYRAAFAAGVVLALVALGGLLLVVREPRARHWSRVELPRA